ncbi:MAG: amidase [Rhodospirillales bacterium]|nr:amidase [Rhodospirillales bacterium]
MSDLTRLSARQMVRLLKRREVSPAEAIAAALARIAATDPAINALPTLCADRAKAHAERIAAGSGETDHPAWLAGLPIAVKDLNDVQGVRTTYGSTIYADHVSMRSDVMVEMLEARGAIVLAKSNTPEFGAGAVTFNDVFGKTRNPWNTTRTPGGSSGGSAAALAAGQVWLATGSDLGGSLRIPAAFSGVVGLRPSPGRVAHAPRTLPFDTLAVDGPMARNVGDLALMLDAMAGEHPEDPISLAAPATSYVSAVDAPTPPVRVGYSDDLGFAPVTAEVKAICRAAAVRFAELGATVDEARVNFRDAVPMFQTLRAARFAADKAELLATRRAQMKPEVVWNIEAGLKLTADDIGKAEVGRSRLYRRLAQYFTTHDLLLCPATQLAPFDIEKRYIEEIEGQRFPTYIDWFSITYVVTLTSLPALSIPCGFTADGLPVGLQMIGRPKGEAALLAAAHLAEGLYAIAPQLPIDPRTPKAA